MKSQLLNLYHQLPPVGRNIAASLRGYQLRSWRYGPDSEELVAEALERDAWSYEKWKMYQENQLAHLLHRAATQVPYYREQWAKRRRGGDHSSWDYLENWPILEKESLQRSPEAFLADDCDKKGMFHLNTSGTTGKPLDLWRNKRTGKLWYAITEARLRRWNDVSRYQNWAIVGGNVVVPSTQQKPPFWVWNSALNQLYLSANHISETNVPAYLEAIKRYRITHMFVYTSSATFLAQQALRLNTNFKQQLQVIITNAEPLFSWQRQIIEQGFQCDARQSYGMAEIVAAASEDHIGRLRQWPDAGYTEVVAGHGDETLLEDEVGRLICTGFLNTDMPLIRYAVGDRGSLSSEKPDTSDQIKLPYMGPIEGRENDMLVARDGRQIFWINPIFYELPVVEAQVIQESLEVVRVLYVPSAAFTNATQEIISQRLRQRIGDMEVQFERQTQIPRGHNGKFRAVICKLAYDQKDNVSESGVKRGSGDKLTDEV